MKEKLTGTVQDVQAGCDGIQVAQWAMEGVGPGTEPEPDTMTQPAALAASSFPQPMTGRRSTKLPQRRWPRRTVQPPPRPGKASPGRTR